MRVFHLVGLVTIPLLFKSSWAEEDKTSAFQTQSIPTIINHIPKTTIQEVQTGKLHDSCLVPEINESDTKQTESLWERELQQSARSNDKQDASLFKSAVEDGTDDTYSKSADIDFIETGLPVHNEPIEPTEPTEPTESTEPSDLTGAIETNGLNESTESTESNEPNESNESSHPNISGGLNEATAVPENKMASLTSIFPVSESLDISMNREDDLEERPSLSSVQTHLKVYSEQTADMEASLNLEPDPTTITDNSKNLSFFLNTFNDTIEGLNNSTYRISNDSDVSEDVNECHFMSFEEWKKQKIGKDAEAFKTAKSNIGPQRVRNDQSHMNSIGEEMEIELNLFGGKEEYDEGKLYKDKFNYASFDCAATIVKTNREAKGASSILFENKDSYLLNECSAVNKFVTIELCQDILVNTVVIGNFEFFSSMFRNIRISVSDRFPAPANGWKVLGEFEAENIRDLQTFTIKNPLIWARYLRLEILSHYGNEYYCPLSLVRVHGKTMMEEFKLEEEEKLNTREEQATETKIAEVISKESNDTCNIASLSNSAKLDENLTSSEECSIILPHLGLDKFLEDMDADAYCQISANPISDNPTSEPVTQESIYKNMMKRLSLLESNASLSLLYIEEQSKLLSTAFTKLEKKQTFKFDLLLDIFNSTIHDQLSHLTKFYDSFQKETESILSNQKLEIRELISETRGKVSSLGNELKFQRRLTILNSIIIICLLIYVIVTRDTFLETEYYGEEENWSNSGSASPTLSREITRKRKFKVSVGHKFKSYIYDDSSFLMSHNRSVSESSLHSLLSDAETRPLSSTPLKENLSNLKENLKSDDYSQKETEFNEMEDTPLTPEYSDHDT